MDLELSDEQVWLEESINTLLDRQWPPRAGRLAGGRGGACASLGQPRRIRGPRRARRPPRRHRALSRRPSARRSPGLGPLPRQRRRALRAGAARRAAPGRRSPRCWTATPAFRSRCSSRARGWAVSDTGDGRGETGSPAPKPPSIMPATPSYFAVVARVDGRPGLALVPSASPGSRSSRRSRASTPRCRSAAWPSSVSRSRRSLEAELAEAIIGRLISVGGLLAAAEAVGAAAEIFAEACRYASERRQFGRTIGSNQALRHLLADLHVRQASSWSTTLFAAAALDDGIPGAPADRVGGQGVRLARRARGRARFDAGLRRHRVHRGASRPPLPAPDHRARAAVRRRRPPRAGARPQPGGGRRASASARPIRRRPSSSAMTERGAV